MAARPARLTKNRHGIFCLRWIVPLSLREKSPGSSAGREIRISLRTTNPLRARILALEFNLALERLKAQMTHQDPREGVSPFKLTTGGGTTIEIRDDDDRRLFHDFLKDDAELREALLQSIRAGVSPQEAMASLVQEVKRTTGALAPVTNPARIKGAFDDFIDSRPTIGANRRTTAGDKRSTLNMFEAHLAARAMLSTENYVHALERHHILDFVNAYAARPSKATRSAAAKQDLDPQELDPADFETVAKRSVVKVIEHLKDFFTYALGQNWIAASPMDEAFDEAVAAVKKEASSERRNNSYTLFDDPDLRVIFEPGAYLKKMSAADNFWAPLIALYTGARSGEIVTLKVEDIVPDTGDAHSTPGMQCHVILIREKEDDTPGRKKKKLKNTNARRRVPVAQRLIELGLLDYVDHVRSHGAQLLFPHLKMNKTRANDPSKKVSRRFGEHLDDVELPDLDKVFHSFRHTVVTRMHVHEVPVKDAELITGHGTQEAYDWLSSAAGQTARRPSTHLTTYTHSDKYAEQGSSLMLRLKSHLDQALNYPLDFERLRAAARIVQERTLPKANGDFVSGWHTNNSKLAEEMLARLAATPVDGAATTQLKQPTATS